MKLNKKLLVMLGLVVVLGSTSIKAMSQEEYDKQVEEALKLAEEYGITVTDEEGNILVEGDSYVDETDISRDFRLDEIQNNKTEVWKKANFLEMRKALEQATNTSVTKNGPYGILYTTYGSDTFGGDWENNSTKDIDYLWGVGNKYMEAWMKSPGHKEELAKIASMSFKDIKGTEWYASHIPTAVYFGVVSGYPDGTFKGNAPVSRAEFATVYHNTKRIFVEKDEVGGASRLTAHKNQWYYTNMQAIANGPMGIDALTVNDMNSGMTRGEVAMILARGFFNNEYMEAPMNVIKFKDIKSISKGIGTWENESDKREQYMKAVKTPKSCPADVVIALNVLKDKGIMGGDSYGNSNWTKTVTRGEVIALLERIAQD